MATDSVKLIDNIKDPEMAKTLLIAITRIIGVINSKKLPYAKRMDEILKIILDYLGVEQGSIMLLKKNYLEVVAASKPELVGERQSLDEKSVATWVVKAKEPLFIPDIANDDRFESRSKKYKKNALLSAPIISEEKIIGVINVTDKTGDKDLFKDDITYLLEFSSIVLWLTVQENLNDNLKRQKDTLKKRNKELRRQEASRADLSRLLIHDLKGPLSEIIANLDILSYSIPGESAEFLEAARIGCERAILMVSNLGSVDTIEDGRLTLIKEVVVPESLLAESISSVKGIATIKGVALKLNLPEKELPVIKLDRILILRVLQNLFTNGIGYSPPGSTIEISCSKVPKKKRLEFSVKDHGSGIPADKIHTVFEKYARLHQEQNAILGTGLGLYFCKLAVDAHRGNIWVESDVDAGSCFYFSLPL